MMPDDSRPTSGSTSPAVRQRAARRAAAIFALYEQGLTQAEIGKLLGIAQTSVSARLRRAGLLTATRKPRSYLTADDYAAMQLLRNRGWRLEAIARRFDTGANNVSRHTARGRTEGTSTNPGGAANEARKP
jgi:transcriptional regulator